MSSDPEDYVFCTMGGSGSTHLRKALEARGLRVHHKPDTAFRRYWVRRGVAAQTAEFERRALGYQMPAMPSLVEVERYLHHVRESPGSTVVLNTWAEQHILSGCGKRRMVFILRHPAAAYRSLCEPGRHGGDANEFGGPNSWFAAFVANRWRSIVEEYFVMAARGWPVSLWPYESLPDHAATDGFADLFADWIPSAPRLGSSLTPRTIELVNMITQETRTRAGVDAWIRGDQPG